MPVARAGAASCSARTCVDGRALRRGERDEHGEPSSGRSATRRTTGSSAGGEYTAQDGRPVPIAARVSCGLVHGARAAVDARVPQRLLALTFVLGGAGSRLR